jgi:GT2 family glycosyltransferase
VRRDFPWVTLIANAGNVGFPAANNQGLAHARGRYVLFLNPDTEVGARTLETLVGVLDRDAGIGMAGCRLMFPDGRVQYEGARRAYRLRHLVWEAFYLHELFPRSSLFAHQLMGEWDHRDTRDVEAILGAFMMVRADLARRLGGLPDDVFMFHEDLAFCLRVRAAGYRIRYVSEVETLHHGGASRVRASTPLSILEGEVRVRLLRERGGPVRAALARPLFAFRSAARLAGALIGRVVPGTARLRAVRPKAFDHRLHALHLAWAIAPAAVRRFMPRAGPDDVAVVLAPQRTPPLGRASG